MTAKITGRVKDSYNNMETAETFDLNKVQDNKTILLKEVWEIPDRKRKGADSSEKRSSTLKKEREIIFAERSLTPNEKIPLQIKRSDETQKGKDILDLNNVQKLAFTDYSAKEEQEAEVSDDNKEIAFFTEPKAVKRKTQRHIFGFQAITAVTVCLIMLLLKFFAPELYDNLHMYYVRLFQW
ncbi:MAG: hypothetical protein K2K41_06705 [Ruminiclostridium sp.]|nr:hypothetical protein [Ruminiclostridium sp.]